MPLFAPGAARPADNHSVVIEFLVDDVDRVHRNLTGLVADFVNEPTTMPWGNRSLLFRDPGGHREVRSLTAGAAARSGALYRGYR